VEAKHFLRLADAGLNVHAGRADLLFHRLLDLLDAGTGAQLLNLLRQHAGRVCQIWVLGAARTGRLLLLLFGVLGLCRTALFAESELVDLSVMLALFCQVDVGPVKYFF